MADQLFQKILTFPLDVPMLAGSKTTTELEAMDLFGAPVPGLDFFSSKPSHRNQTSHVHIALHPIQPNPHGL